MCENNNSIVQTLIQNRYQPLRPLVPRLLIASMARHREHFTFSSRAVWRFCSHFAQRRPVLLNLVQLGKLGYIFSVAVPQLGQVMIPTEMKHIALG